MSEKIPKPAEQITPLEQSRKEAEEIYNQHKDQLEGYAPREIDGIKTVFGQYPNLIDEYLRNVPKEIQSHFWAHGIARGDKLEQLTAAISILENKAICGDTSRLAGSGYIDAWTQGGFLLLSNKDGELIPKDRTIIILGENPRTQEPIKAVKIKFGALVANDQFYWVVGDLKKMFPDLKILYPHELLEYLSH